MSKLKKGLLIVLGIVILMILLVFCGYTVTPWPSVQNKVRREIHKNYGKLTKEDYAKTKYLAVSDYFDIAPVSFLNDINILDKLQNLYSLHLFADTKLSTIEALHKQVNLKKLTLGLDNSVTDNPDFNLEPLTGLKKLEFLWLITFSGKIDLSPLAVLSNLKELKLAGRDEIDLSPLSELPNLEILETHYTDSNSSYIYAPIPNLKKIKISSPPHRKCNQKINLNDFSGMTNLEEFICDLECDSDIDSISHLSKLRILWLERGGNISDLSFLNNFPNMQHLGLDAQQISDLTPLLEMNNLVMLSIRGNPLDEKSINEIIPILSERGVDVRV